MLGAVTVDVVVTGYSSFAVQSSASRRSSNTRFEMLIKDGSGWRLALPLALLGVKHTSTDFRKSAEEAKPRQALNEAFHSRCFSSPSMLASTILPDVISSCLESICQFW